MSVFLKYLKDDKYLVLGLILFLGAILGEYIFKWSSYILPITYILSYLLIGKEILINTVRNVSKGDIFDENFLMTVASVGAIALGFYAEAVAVILFYKVGEFFQEMASDNAIRSVQSMLGIMPETSNMLKDGKVEVVASELVAVGSEILVYPGEKIPLDGIVVRGSSSINTASLTGESAPRVANVGDGVLAGTINGEGLLHVQTTKVMGETIFSKAVQLVKDARQQKGTTENFITSFARYYTPAVVFIAVAVALLPPIITGESYDTWIYRALIFLVISCPCALVVSVPLSFFAGIGAGAKNGIFIKGSQYLEAIAQIKTVVFDKTGTLTTGEFEVLSVIPVTGKNADSVLYYAALAEQRSNHPIAKSILRKYTSTNKETLTVEYSSYKEAPGLGVVAEVNGETIIVGKSKFARDNGVITDSESGVVVSVNGELYGYIEVGDVVRAESALAISEMKSEGVDKFIILSGDREEAVKATADALSIKSFFFNLMPADKLAKLQEVLAGNIKGKLAFVGDGVNDAPSLAIADVGVAMGGSGADAALEAADVVILKDDLLKLPKFIQIAKFTRKIAYQNIVFSISVKIIIMVIGTFGYANLWSAIFADVGVALIAILNAMRILRS